MSAVIEILLFLVAWVCIAVVCHAFIRRYYLASFVAACLAVAGAQVASYIELGNWDPFWLITSVTGFFMASIIALIVGLPFRMARKVGREDI